jgi:hypothetical protein
MSSDPTVGARHPNAHLMHQQAKLAAVHGCAAAMLTVNETCALIAAGTTHYAVAVVAAVLAAAGAVRCARKTATLQLEQVYHMHSSKALVSLKDQGRLLQVLGAHLQSWQGPSDSRSSLSHTPP